MRAGRTPSRRARELQLEFLKKGRWPLLALAALLLAITVPILVFAGSPLVSFSVGAADASVAWLTVLSVIEATGSSTWRMGAQAERWTAEQLGRLGGDWRTVHAIGLPFGDVDHVAIGPGGAYAIETKWSSETWRVRDFAKGRRLDRAADQVWNNRRAVQSRLRTYYERVPVTPVIVLWGKTEDGVTGQRGEVQVLHGSELRAWLAAQPQVMDAAAVSGAGDGLVRYQRTLTQDRESQSRFIEVGAEGVLREIACGVFGGISGVVLATVVLLQADRAFFASIAGVVALVAVGTTARRYGRGLVRLFGLGLAIGTAMFLIVVAVQVAVLLLVRPAP